MYSTPEVRGNADTTLVGKVDMSLTQGGTDLAAGVPVVRDSRAAADLGQNPGATPGEVVMASLRAMQTMQTQMAAQETQLIAGMSGSLEGDRSSQGPSPREDMGRIGSSGGCIGAQRQVS